MAITYILSATNSDLAGGADFGKKLVTPTETAGTISVPVTPNGTDTSYAWTEPGVPGASGVNTGTWTVEIEVVTAASQVTVRPNLSRVNSAGVVQTGPIQPAQAAAATSSTGVKTFTWTNPALGTWAAGDRLRVGYAFTSSTNQARTPVIRTGTTATEVITPFVGTTAQRTVTPVRAAISTTGARTITPARVAISVVNTRQVTPNKAAIQTTGNARTVTTAAAITIPPQAVVSWAEFEVPDPVAVTPRTITPNAAAISATNQKTSTPVRAAISTTGRRTVTAAAAVATTGNQRTVPSAAAISLTHAQVSWAELEVPDAPAITERAVDAAAAISTTGMRTVTPVRASISLTPQAVVSWAELEVPDAPTSGGSSPRTVPATASISGGAQKGYLLFAISWDVGGSLARVVPAFASITVGNERIVPASAAISDVHAEVSWAEFEVPDSPNPQRMVSPVRAAISTTGARTVTPVRAAIGDTAARTVTPNAAVITTINRRTVTARAAISTTGHQRTVTPNTAAIGEIKQRTVVATVTIGDAIAVPTAAAISIVDLPGDDARYAIGGLRGRPPMAFGQLAERPSVISGGLYERPSGVVGRLQERSSVITGSLAERPALLTGALIERPPIVAGTLKER